MKTALAFAVLFSASLLAVPPRGAAIKTGSGNSESVDVVDAIECRLDAPTYNGFAMALTGKDGIAGKRRWKEITSANRFMKEYELPTSIVVAGLYRTRRIAFTSTGVVAILDVPDPVVVARTAGIAGRFRGFLGERVIANGTGPADGKGVRARDVIIRSVANVTTYPGKTLYGCSYWIHPLDKDGKPL